MRNLLLTFCLYASVSLNAINYDVSNLTNNDGLSNSSVNTIFQDTQGLLWFGTWDGLNAFNGREFTAYKPDPGNNRTISNNIIRDMVEAPKGILWIATDRGINRLDESKHAFERFFVEAGSQRAFSEHSFLIAKTSSNDVFAAVFDQGLFYFNASSHRFVRLNLSGHVKIRKLFFDQDDHLWFYTEEKELFKIIFRKSRSTIPQIRHIEKFQHLKDIDAVFYNPDHELWLQTSGGTCYSYQISEGLLTEYPVAFKQIGSIRTVIFGEDRQLIGTADGLFRYDLKTRQLETLLPNVSVLSILSGTQQIIWVGTDMQGVWQLSPPREKIRSYSSGTIPLFGRSAVRAIFEDRNNTLWVGTKGSGIYLFPPNGEYPGAGYAKRFTTKDGLLSDAVFTIVQGQQHEYWIGTDGRGINYYDINTKRIQSLFVKEELRRHVNLSSVYSILPADQNTLWVGTSGYGMYKLTVDRSSSPYTIKDYKQFIFRNGSSTALSNNIVYSIIRGDKTHLWIATRGGGLNRFDCQKETFQSYRYSSADPNSISSDDILCLYKDKQGFLWAGTSMGLNKLVRFHNQSPVFVRFTEKEGMPNNTIHGMLQDKEHSMWLSTNNGIANLLFEHGAYRIIPYFRKDGLQNNEFSDGAFYESPYSHKFYFGGINGFNVFNASGITHSNYMPSLLLDAFYVENSETNLPDMLQKKRAGNTLVLPYKDKSFSFKFIPLDYISGSKCELSYLLEGYQKDWIHLGTSNTIVFSNLPTGHYVLKVRCSNANKIWSKHYYTLPVIILPPWWASPFAYFCYFVLFFLILYGIRRLIRYQLTVRRDFRMKELEKQKIEAIHQAKLSFFTNIAHEFSNSLTLIYGPCEQLLRGHSNDDETRKYVNIIKSNSERMQTLIQQMIDFRKAETGHLKLDIERIEIPELIKFVLDNFIERLEEKKIRLTLDFSPEVTFWQTDRDSIEKIVFNLISNAVKYTPAEETITVKVEKKEELLYLSVTNTGVGIKPTFQRQIFDRFEVLDRFEMQVSKGYETRNGIGLALCKNVVEVLHGNIEVDSDGETYTTFVVSVPEQPMVQAVPEPVQSASPVQPVVGTRTAPREEVPGEERPVQEPLSPIPDIEKDGLILVIDDDKGIRQLLKDILNERYEVAEATNGQDAIELMRIRLPLVIVCDVIMPVMDGVKFVKIMKGQELTRHIPIILLSSKSTIENQIEGLETGADAYLNKPFHPRHLEALIESLLHRNKAVLEYGESVYASLEQYEGKFIHKEDKELMLHITDIIHKHIDDEALSLDFVARETAISKMQLYRKIKEITGQTPTEYIRSIRLKHAEKLLKTTNKTVQEIMFFCGFNNKAYFYREFSKKYHVTPKEYRNQK